MAFFFLQNWLIVLILPAWAAQQIQNNEPIREYPKNQEKYYFWAPSVKSTIGPKIKTMGPICAHN